MQTGPWTAQHKPKVGTSVMVNPVCNSKFGGIKYTVKNHRVKTVLLTPVDGYPGQKDLIISPEMLIPTPVPQSDVDPLHSTVISTQTATIVEEPIPSYEKIVPGAVVRVAGPGWKQSPEKLYVILVDNTYKNKTVKITDLGGTRNGTFWPKVPSGYITVVPLADILK
jgi:hypothetical protein